MCAVTALFSFDIATRLLDAGAALEPGGRSKETVLHSLVRHHEWSERSREHAARVFSCAARGSTPSTGSAGHRSRSRPDDSKPVLFALVLEGLAADPPLTSSWATLQMLAEAGKPRGRCS